MVLSDIIQLFMQHKVPIPQPESKYLPQSQKPQGSRNQVFSMMGKSTDSNFNSRNFRVETDEGLAQDIKETSASRFIHYPTQHSELTKEEEFLSREIEELNRRLQTNKM